MCMRKLMLSVGVFALSAGLAVSADAAKVKRLPSGAAASDAQIAAMLRSAQPKLRRLDRLPSEASRPLQAMGGPVRITPSIVPGHDGPVDDRPVDDPGAPGIGAQSDAITPQDYGVGNLNTVYHYTDKLVEAAQTRTANYRPTGWLQFVAAGGGSFRCTAELISRSIAVTAGHCVHDGGNGNAGWIRSGSFSPAYNNGNRPYGSANVDTMVTTNGWFGTGALDAGYDVGLIVLGKRVGTNQEIGAATGWYGFCTSNCLQPYWYNTQLGYPGNYYSGQRMTEGQHLERSDSRDYIYGSGMEGGSSGGGHIANHGALQGSAGSAGQWAFRNIVFAVTSWGYLDRTLKIQGASSLSGPSNSNNFRAMFNAACNRARQLHGNATCSLI
jgi:V8-like Glu-specific endopeptidase